MNDRSDIDLVLGHWLEDGPVTMPDRVVDVVARRIAVRPQRRSWRLLRRSSPMPASFKLVAAVAAVIVLAFVGYNLLPPGPSIGTPTTPPTASEGPTPTPSDGVAATSPVDCEDGLAGCAGPLAAGAHQSAQFGPPFEYTTPAGWINSIDTEELFALVDQPGQPDPILVWSNVTPAETTAACELQAAPVTGTSASDWLAYLTTHPGLIATNQHEVQMNGSSVTAVDVEPNPAWSSPCATDRASLSVAIIKTQPGGLGDGYGVLNTSRARLYLVGVGNQVVVVTVYSYAPSDPLADVVLRSEPVVATFTWACNADSPAGPCWGPSSSGQPATPPPAP